LERALLLDPQFAAALNSLAATFSGTDRARQLELLDRCLALSPSAGSCLRGRLSLKADQGRCAELEADARRLAVIEPKGARTFEVLAIALAAREAPLETVAEVLGARVPLKSGEGARRLAEIQNRAWMTTLAGDLDGAERAARQWQDEYKDSRVGDDHDSPMTYLLDVLDEKGEVGKAIDEGEAYARRSRGWTGNTDFALMRGLSLLRRTHRIDEATFRARRDEMMGKAAAAGASKRDLWESFYPEYAATREEATEALSEMPADVTNLNALFEAVWVGKLYLLAGQPDAALPHLRRGAASCSILSTSQTARAYTIWWVRAHAWLGEALEKTGDSKGACDAYRPVVNRWKDAKSHSVTLAKARDRMKALACSM
jgi:hypothetical protein